MRRITLFNIWCADHTRYRPWICDGEILKFGLRAGHTRAVLSCAEKCLRGMDEDQQLLNQLMTGMTPEIRHRMD